jgi:ATP-dependent Clp protease ATP-binding subunit ClpC
MFEKYTEKARRVIFFGRYEASQLHSSYIEPEHLLLGLLREDKFLAHRFLGADAVEPIRKEIEERRTPGAPVSPSVDLPMSSMSKRVLAYAAEEAERLSDKHIGPEHQLLGLLREETGFAAELLRKRGLNVLSVRQELSRTQSERSPRTLPAFSSLFLTPHLKELALPEVLGGRLPTLEEALKELVERPPDQEALKSEGWWKTPPNTPEGWQNVNEFRYRQLVLALFAAHKRIQELEARLADLARGGQNPPIDPIT